MQRGHADQVVNVRYWHKADIGLCAAHVRFTQKADIRRLTTSAPSGV